MTTWREVGDVIDEEFDEFDPMAAPGYSTIGEDEEEVDSSPEWGPDKGFPDGLGIARLWTDETGLIIKARLSPSWREKLGKGSLASHFAQSFSLINTYYAKSETESLDSDKTREAKYPLSWERISHYSRRAADLRSQLADLGPRAHGTWQGKPAVGESPDRLVAIQLTIEGMLGEITFDKAKLEQSRVRQITDGIVRAHANARANFVPPTYVPGEGDQLREELRDIRNEMLAMMRRGFN